MVVFTRILIANRSEIARRIIRTCRAMGIETVAVFTPPDSDAPFVHEADIAVELTSPSGYLDGDAVIAAALATGSDAIHPGYGFLSENAPFARAVGDAGIVFIGPAPETIEVMGSKFEAIETMRAAGVPVARSAAMVSHEDPVETAYNVGYPLVLKASAGGGGRGMRIIESGTGLLAEIMAAMREAESAFGDGRLYFERFIPDARHIEVQVFGDVYGNIVHLHERECSVQRRFQKVIEEAPAPLLSSGLRRRLLDAAVAAAGAVDYVGAGTVEFLVGRDGEFMFMEMNTRLQVEHPVTEAITGLDIVRMQIEVAAGERLPSQKELPTPSGHAIEARLYAEQPDDGYLPSTGTMERFVVPGPVRVDTGIEDGSVITHHYDPMVAKVISHRPTRHEAAAVLAKALHGAEIHGVETNRDLLVHALGHAGFLAGDVHTTWLEIVRTEMPEADERVTRASAAAATLSIAKCNRDEASILPGVPSGWRNVRSQPMALTLIATTGELEIDYVIHEGGADVAVGGEPLAIDTVYFADGGLVDMTVDGIRIRFSIHHVGDEVYVDSALGARRFSVPPRFPTLARANAGSGSLTAPTPGTVVAVAVSPGDQVSIGDVLVVIESMKMEQSVTAPVAGLVTVAACQVGDNVSAGDVLIEIDEQEPTDG